MNRRSFVGSCAVHIAARPDPPPNIVVVLADDLGFGDLSCYGGKLPTPHADRIAREGIRYSDAHSGSAVCSPSRYGVLTGRYCWRTSLRAGVLGPWDPPLIERGRLTLPLMLKREGYHTACIGKWHLGWVWPKGDDPRRFREPIAEGPITCGFDSYFGVDVPNYPPYCFIEQDRTVGIPTDFRSQTNLDGLPGPMMPDWRPDHILPKLVDRAVRYIHGRARSRQPFFLYFSLTSPHEPIAPSAKFRGKSGINLTADFMLETDAAVGSVLRALDVARLSRDTLVIFTADNGHAIYTDLQPLLRYGHAPSGPLRGYKSSLYEGGHRVPFVARWPARIKAGSSSDRLICLNDFMATMAEMLGIHLPSDAAEDSISFWRDLSGGQPGKRREGLVHHSARGQFAIRQGRWKLLLPGGTSGGARRPTKLEIGREELYDLSRDIGETRNRRDEFPEVAASLARLLESYKVSGRSREVVTVAGPAGSADLI